MSPWIQCLIVKLQRYSFDLVYTPGKHLALADALSQASQLYHMYSMDKGVENHVDMIVESLPMSDAKIKHVCEEKEPQTLMKHIQNVWPKGSCLKCYHVRSQLSVANRLLLRGNRIVIPHVTHVILQRIH